MMDLDRDSVRALALGGGVLGGGGGGEYEEGLRLLELALELGRPSLKSLDDLDDDAVAVTVSGVGAPAAVYRDVRVTDYLASVELFLERSGTSVAGMVSSENGGFSSANGFVQSALTGIPVIDAACNGRAHPSGVMGSMGLHRLPGYLSKQSAVGGSPGARGVRLYVEGALRSVDHVVRQAAVAAGGLVSVTRNPVEASYLRTHGAPGALTLAVALGELVMRSETKGARAVVEAILEHFGAGEVLVEGDVSEISLRTEGGYDVGSIKVRGLEATFWNEFMTVDGAGKRRATFPDLMFALDARTGLPLTTAEIERGREIVLASVPKDRLPLGSGVKDPEVLREVEQVLGVPGVA